MLYPDLIRPHNLLLILYGLSLPHQLRVVPVVNAANFSSKHTYVRISSIITTSIFVYFYKYMYNKIAIPLDQKYSIIKYNVKPKNTSTIKIQFYRKILGEKYTVISKNTI